jgi:hypothetical protein
VPPGKRNSERRRTRLRSGKIADAAGRFIVECMLHDRSEAGARLRPVASAAIPERIVLYDDERETAVAADIIWRRGLELGCRFTGAVMVADNPVVRRLSGRFYAL